MKRLLLTLVAALAFVGSAQADEFNVGSVQLYNGTPCAPSQCQLSTIGGYDPHTVATGSSRAYLGWFYVYPDMSYRYVSFNANSYIGSSGYGYQIAVQGRVWCSGYWHYSPAKWFYEKGTSSYVYFGVLQMLSPC